MIPYFLFDNLSLGPISINVWGLMVMIGVIASLFVARSEAARRSIDPALILNAGGWIVFFGLVGSRLFFAANEWFLFEQRPWAVLFLWEGGLAWYGGVIGGVIGLWLFHRVEKIKNWLLIDVFAFSIPAGEFFGRLGCFFIHDHLGKITTCTTCLATLTKTGDLRFDSGLYLALNAGFLFMLFLFIRKKRPRATQGLFLSLYFIEGGIARFLLDFTRENITVLPTSGDPVWGHFFPAQYFSILMFLFGVIFLKIFIKRKSEQKGKNSLCT